MTRLRDALKRLAQYGTLDDAEVATRLSTGLAEFISRWERETLAFILAGGAELRFVEGPYGRGKTHFLLALQVAAQRAGFVTARVQCRLQHQPFASIKETYRAIATTMSTVQSSLAGASDIGALLSEISPEQLAAYHEKGRANPGFRNVVVAYVKRMQAGQERHQVTRRLRALLLNEEEPYLTFSELFRLDRHLPRPLGRIGKRNAANWLRSLLSLPRDLGLNGLVVLFDETGADLHLRQESTRSRQQHMAHLRNLVDHLAIGDIPGCSIVYATTNDFIQMAREDYPALSQRIERLEEVDLSMRQANPRAIWSRLDELTNPGPDRPEFYVELGEKLLSVAKEAGLPARHLAAVRRDLGEFAQKMSQNLNQAAVRTFTKRLAGQILTGS